jgi:hypothetical protein
MPRPSTVKYPARLLALATLLVLTAVTVAACGGSSTPTSASVGASSKTSGASSGSGSTSGSTTGSTATTTSGSGRSRRHVKKAGKTSSDSTLVPRRHVKASALQRCLESNGVDTHGSGSKAPTRAQLKAALAHCESQRVPRKSSRSTAARRALLAQPSYRRALARFTSCMRSHGVPDFPEANTSGKGPLYPASSVKSTPQLRTAQQACIGELRAG